MLIIADGWDELGESERGEGSFLHDLLLTGKSFTFISVVLTSCPINCFCSTSQTSIHALVCGFDEENNIITEYIESEFDGDQEKASRLLEQLVSSPLVERVCSIPAPQLCHCLSLVAHSWGSPSHHHDRTVHKNHS